MDEACLLMSDEESLHRLMRRAAETLSDERSRTIEGYLDDPQTWD